MRVFLPIILKMELLFLETKQCNCSQKIEIMTLNIIEFIISGLNWTFFLSTLLNHAYLYPAVVTRWHG